MSRTKAERKAENAVEIVTVARQGARMAKVGCMSFPIFCTAVYRAMPRAKDGVVTWRRVESYGDGTAGARVTAAMVARAQTRAEERGVLFVVGVRHGDTV